MKEQELQAIEARWAKAIQGQYVVKKNYNTEIYLGPVKKCEFGFSHKGKILEMEDADCSDFSKSLINNTAHAIASAPTDVADLLAEVRRLRCCGNCRKQQYDGMDYFCDEDNCEKYSLWEAAGNG